MFRTWILRERARQLGHMTKRLALDFVGLQRSVARDRIEKVWHGSSLTETQDSIDIQHPYFPMNTFSMEGGPYPESEITRLIVTGRDDWLGLSIYANQQYFIGEIEPFKGKGFTKTLRKLVNTLETDYEILFIKPALENKKRAKIIKGDDQKKVILAGLTASIIVGLADGTLTHEKKDRLVELAGTGMARNSLPGDILTAVEKHTSAVVEMGRDAWPATMRSLTDNLSGESKKIILHGAGNMALTDGNISEREKEVIQRMAFWIQVEEDDFNDWAKDFELTIRKIKILS